MQNAHWLRDEVPSKLFFAPLAWLKLQHFCHVGDTEIGGFGISSPHNPLYVQEFVTVRQEVTPVSVYFDDEAVSTFFDDCVDRKLSPDRFARIWLHTHPGSSPDPSMTDEETFARCFGRCDWSVMFILGRTGLTYARLSFAAGPGCACKLPVVVDWSSWPKVVANGFTLDTQIAEWQREFAANIHAPQPLVNNPAQESGELIRDDWWDVEPWSHDLDDINFTPANWKENYVPAF